MNDTDNNNIVDIYALRSERPGNDCLDILAGDCFTFKEVLGNLIKLKAILGENATGLVGSRVYQLFDFRIDELCCLLTDNLCGLATEWV